MVNYCCVAGCGRNSRSSQTLNYYSVPKETSRQEEWFRAAGRPELLKKPTEKRILYRFCSRHFAPSCFINKHLYADAVPTLCLPGLKIDDNLQDIKEEGLTHEGIVCDHCGNIVSGFRYKCLVCPDYDLCSRCEMNEAHSQHYVIRIPTPNKSNKIEEFIQEWQQLHTTDSKDNDSSDDEPITKYIKLNKKVKDQSKAEVHPQNILIELPEDMKKIISDEVDRVLAQNSYKKKRSFTRIADSTNMQSKRSNVGTDDMSKAPEVVFADCSAELIDGNRLLDIKMEPLPVMTPLEFTTGTENPFMQIKPTNNLSEIEVQRASQTITLINNELL